MLRFARPRSRRHVLTMFSLINLMPVNDLSIMLLLHLQDSGCVFAKRGAMMARVLHPWGLVNRVAQGQQV